MIGTIWRHPTGRLGFCLVVLVVVFAVAGPWLIPDDPAHLDIRARFASPSLRHWAGTDGLGRDLLVRLAAGGRVALGVSVATITAALVVGTALGVAAARGGAWGQAAIMGALDVVAAFPSLLFALAAVALLGPGAGKIVFLVALTLAPQYARVARAQTTVLAAALYVEAARVVGLPPWRLWLRTILPNIAGPLVVLAGMDIPTVITLEAGLSFLGVGLPPPAASWGGMLYDGYLHLEQSIWPAVGSATLLVAATLGFALTAEALRDATDPAGRRAM